MEIDVEINWIIVTFVLLIAVFIIVFTIRKNKKEKQKLKKFLDQENESD